MANFEPKQLVANEINGGNKYRNLVDSPQSDAFNRLIEAILYAQQNGSSINITIDRELSSTSENPVQNKVVKAELDKKLDINSPTTTGYPSYLYGYSGSEQKVLRYNVQGGVGGANFNRHNMIVVSQGTGQVKGAMPINPEDLTPKEYVDDLFDELTNTQQQWREVYSLWGSSNYLSATILGEPLIAKITECDIYWGQEWMNMETGEPFSEYKATLIAPQTFDNLTKTNGEYTVAVNFKKETMNEVHYVTKTEDVVIPISFKIERNQTDGTTAYVEQPIEGYASNGSIKMSLYI